MQLVEAGQIDLDEPAQTYLPWFRVADEETSAQITVRQLLNQDSGISTASGRQTIGSDDQSDEAINNAVRALADDQLSSPVGKVYKYSNANFQVLGAVEYSIEDVLALLSRCLVDNGDRRLGRGPRYPCSTGGASGNGQKESGDSFVGNPGLTFISFPDAGQAGNPIRGRDSDH